MSTEAGGPLALVTGASSGIGREQMHGSMAKPGSGD